ncbi:DEAD/DEAH box helicase family protein [Massilia sp. BKSP1R2A-1]|uniref:DEAD/DEAH box helicase family protein n=1 Tax=Massilia sp. BKSP1R2A-1 TaxID=3422595 RepID=UPI003D3491E5
MKQSFDLRPYQVDSVEGLRNLIRQGVRNMILSVPTGGGKTVIASYLTAECYGKAGKRAVFVADRIALINQTSETFDRYGIPHGVVQGDHWRFKPWERVQVASAQTLAKRGWPDADLIIVDECHAIQATVAERLAGRDTVVIGLTATPMTQGLGKLYDGIVTVITTNQLIAAGFLVPFRVYAASAPDMTGAKTRAGEWTDKDAAERSMPIIGDCVEEYLRHAAGKKFIAFGCNVEHCEEMQRQFAAAGVVSELYTYRTDDAARDPLVEEFRKPDSSVRGLISVSALSKGFDVSDVEVIIMARPLKSSLAEHIQILGRGLRIHPGKKECIVLDHSGNCVRFWGAMQHFLEKGITELDDGMKKKQVKVTPGEKKPVTCPNCKHVHTAMPACPSCGHSYKKKQPVEHVAGSLHEVKGGTKPAPPTQQEKREFFAQLNHIALEKGRKPGWVSHKYKEKFGSWPDFNEPVVMVPSPEVLKWVKSRDIAFAKGARK